MAMAEVSIMFCKQQHCLLKCPPSRNTKYYYSESCGAQNVQIHSAAKSQYVLCKIIHLGPCTDSEFCQVNSHRDLKIEEWITSCLISLLFLRRLKGFVHRLLNRAKPNLLSNSSDGKHPWCPWAFLMEICVNAFAFSSTAENKIVTNRNKQGLVSP